MAPSRKRPSLPTAPKEVTWEAYAPEVYRAASQVMGHFSAKTVNSNASPVGIRLARDQGVHLPYLSVRTLLSAGTEVPIDYAKTSWDEDVSLLSVVKQIRAATNQLPGVPPEEGATLSAEHRRIAATPWTSGLDAVSPRLRQVLIPRHGAPGNYVSLSPLSSAGVAHLLKREVARHNERMRTEGDKAFQETHRHIKRAVFSVGGTNPQNVGSLARDLQTLVFVRAPREKPTLREAFSIFHAGPRIRLSRALMTDYARWYRARQQAGGAETLADRETHRAHLRGLVDAVLRSVQRQREVLLSARDRLPLSDTDAREARLSSEAVDPLLRALLDPRDRTSAWPRQMARHLVDRIAGYRFLGAGEGRREVGAVPAGVVLGLDLTERAWAVAQIEEMLWSC